MDDTRKEVVLLTGPLAPPVGGMTNSLENLLNSDLRKYYDLRVLDITGKRSREKCSLISAVVYQISLLWKLVSTLIKEKPCIVHVQMASFLYFYRRSLDILLCKLFGKKVIFHLRGASFVEFYEKNSFLGKPFIRFILNISDKIVALSEVWRDYLLTFVPPEKIAVIPNGVDCSNLSALIHEKAESAGNNSHIRALFMGSIGKRKGVFDILRAVRTVTRHFPEMTFTFLGVEEENGALAGFTQEVKENHLENHISYPGAISGDERYDYYLSSDIFVLPSYAENFPNAVLEAMAAGLPLVVSNVGAIPEFVKDGMNGFVIEPGDVNALAEKIILLAKDPELRKQMGQRNLELVRKNYDMPIIAEKVHQLYKELLQDSAG
jgi:glycosyltransferase involved in cell wall biosynthesis